MSKIIKNFSLMAIVLIVLQAQAASQDLKLGAPFVDNAVLQREMKVPVWGWHKPGTRVTVEFAGQKKTGVAGKQGKWVVWLDPLKASFEPGDLKVSAQAGGNPQVEQVTVHNVVVGEVWLASGQSNMQWKVTKSSCNKLKLEADDKFAPIREFEVTSVYSALHPIEKATGEWKNGDYNDYSAIAYAFAHKLYNELKVPIGILNCSFSSTKIQAWIPRIGFSDAKDEYTKKLHQQIRETDPTTPEHKAAWDKYYRSLEEAMKENDELVKQGEPPKAIPTKGTPGNMNDNRDSSWLFNGRLNPVVPYAIRGGIWNQGYANMEEGLPYYNNLHSLVRGWRLRWENPELPVYFHQFYCPGRKGEWDNSPDIGSCAEMRLGTCLARDIPGTGMASQIDITGGIHYFHKAVPGQRLALHALKNQYGKKVIADGPIFKSYKVKGSELVIEFDHAEGGLVVAETGFNAIEKKESSTGFADPKIIENGEGQVKLFYLTGEDRVWHPAIFRIDGEKVIVTAPGVKKPRGVSYATGGVGFQPNLYNKALLPTSPFIYYDNKLVTSDTWPDEKPQVAGVFIDPDTVGIKAEWNKMPLLSTQFRDNAVLQSGVPITIWGSAAHDYGHLAEGDAVIKFSFGGIEKTIPVKKESPEIITLGPGKTRNDSWTEWQVTVPAMEASAEPKTLKVTFSIDGEIAHERICTNIVVGDLWYVAAPSGEFELKPSGNSGSPVRMMKRKAKRFSNSTPSRYSVCVSRTPYNRFASEWTDATGFAATLGHSIAAKTGTPVGIIFMQSGLDSQGKGKPSINTVDLSSWIAHDSLSLAPSLMEDYKIIGARYPGSSDYNATLKRYIEEWKKYWSDYIPAMMATKSVPDGAAWGWYPRVSASLKESNASQVYNTMVHPFTPASLKGIIFISSKHMVEEDQGEKFGSELSALANCWKKKFGGDPHFFYSIPDKTLAPELTRPGKINGKNKSFEVNRWPAVERDDKDGAEAVHKQMQAFIDEVVGTVCN